MCTRVFVCNPDSPLSTEGEYRVEALVNVPTLVSLDEEEYELAEVEEAEEVRLVFGPWGGLSARACACACACARLLRLTKERRQGQREHKGSLSEAEEEDEKTEQR